MANQKFLEFRHRIESSVVSAVAMSVNDVKSEEERLARAGWQVAGKFEKFVRAWRAGVAAFTAVLSMH